MKKNKGLSALLIVLGIIILFFAWSETAALTGVPAQNPTLSHEGLNVYSFNVTMKESTVLTVINASGSYGLVPQNNAHQALTGNVDRFAVTPSNVTGYSLKNLTYSGISGNYVFIEQSSAGYAPFVIVNGNGIVSSVSGLIIVVSILLVIGGVFTYPFRRDREERHEQPEEEQVQQ